MATGDIQTFSAKIDPRQSIVMDGVDDYVQVDAWATDRQTANDTVGTITAWINPDVLGATTTIIAAGDVNGDEFIDFSIVSGLLHIELSIAGATSFDIEADNIAILPNVWTHVAIVQDGILPVLYVNGVKVDATLDAGTDTDHWFNDVTLIDAGNIGILDANTSLTQDMNGAIGEIKHWNAAFTAEEILKDFEGSSQSSSINALQVSNWKWNRNLLDSWVGANNGSAVNNAFLDNDFTSITSFLRSITTIVADDISLSVDGGVAHVVRVSA